LDEVFSLERHDLASPVDKAPAASSGSDPLTPLSAGDEDVINEFDFDEFEGLGASSGSLTDPPAVQV
jgi:hypothetical protein